MGNQTVLSRTVLPLLLSHTLSVLGTATLHGYTPQSDSIRHGNTPHSDSIRHENTPERDSTWQGYTHDSDSTQRRYTHHSDFTRHGHTPERDFTWHGNTPDQPSTQNGHVTIHQTDSTLTKPWLRNTTIKTSRTKDDNSLSMQCKYFEATLSPRLLTTTPCEDSEYTLTNRTGAIAVKYNAAECIGKQIWNIVLLSSEDGMVIQFDKLYITHCFVLEIFFLSNISHRVRELASPWHSIRPLFLKANEARVVLYRASNTRLRTTFPPDLGVLTYTAHPIRKMPEEIEESDSLDFYICSGDILVPPALRCNKVRECAGNEDEHGCDYTDTGCGDWLPLRDHCLKLVFHGRNKDTRNKSDGFDTLLSKVKETCSTRYGARLAQLRDMDDVRFVGGIIRQAGFRMAIVAVSRVKFVSQRLSHLYRFMWQWGDKGSPMMYEQQPGRLDGNCAVIDVKKQTGIHIETYHCTVDGWEAPDGYVCMKQSSSHGKVQVVKPLSVHLKTPTKNTTRFPTRQCKDGSFVHIFHRCYHEKRQARVQTSPSVTAFLCLYGPPVHYTLVCDGNVDCADGSDEARCGPVRLPPLLDLMFRCNQFQLVPKHQRCDGKQDCFDGSDESVCAVCTNKSHVVCPVLGCLPKKYSWDKLSCNLYDTFGIVPTVCHDCSYVVSMEDYGVAYLKPLHSNNTEGVISCRDGDYSIPSYLINNGELDCKYGEDENIPLTNLTCPGFYRCLDSNSCVHPDHVCDSIHHCPNKDDERYCRLRCPYGCACEGHALICQEFTKYTHFLQARSLDLSGSVNLTLHDIHFLELLQYLNLSRCRLNTLTLKTMPQLRILDFSGNEMKNITSFVLAGLSGLTYMDISNNPFSRGLDYAWGDFVSQSDLSNLESLILRHTELHSITDRSLSQLTHLEVLDIRENCLAHYDKHVFRGLHSLQQLYTDDPKLCCPYFHYSDTVDCVAPLDELSSCSDLLRQTFFRVFLWLVALLAILGNIAVVLHRLFGGKVRAFSSFRVFVSNLSLADLVMGVYMLMIGIADAQFQGKYVAKDNAWRGSIICKSAGLLGFTSSEASVLTICLITLDRVLVLCFPLKSQFHFGVRTSLAACGAVWFVAVILAALPLMAGLQFYGVSSICLPLPITRRQFSGQSYSFSVFIVFNFVVFLVIELGQILIYCAILKASKAAGTTRRTQEMTIARRLFFVILSDFCCWFPIGLMGILVATGIHISDEVNVWAAIFVIPLNSAFNPFLYTLINFLQKRKEEKLKKKAEKILASMQSQLPKLQPSTAEELVKICIRSKVVRRDRVLQILQLYQGCPETIPTA